MGVFVTHDSAFLFSCCLQMLFKPNMALTHLVQAHKGHVWFERIPIINKRGIYIWESPTNLALLLLYDRDMCLFYYAAMSASGGDESLPRPAIGDEMDV
jgi:hypothetical protein